MSARRHSPWAFALTCAALTLMLAIGVAGLLAPALPAHAAGESFSMQWGPEGMFVGTVGATKKTVTRNEATLTYADGRWTGTVGYTDVLGIFDGGGTVSQVAVIDLQLTGAPSSATAASGTFTGTVTMYTRPAASLDEASTAAQAKRTDGFKAVYDVSGRWAATIVGSTAKGELAFGSVGLRRGASGPTRDLSWFTPASAAAGTDVPDGQRFTIAIVGPVPVAPKPSTGATHGGTSATGGGASSAPRPTSFLGYVRQGVSGIPEQLPPPVAPELRAAAERLSASKPVSATPLPDNALATDIDVPGALLDAKNTAAGLYDPNARSSEATMVYGASQEWAFVVARMAAGARGGATTATVQDSDVVSDIPGVAELRGDLPTPPLPAITDRVRPYLRTLQALTEDSLVPGGLLLPTANTTRGMLTSQLDLASPEAGPVLSAAGSPDAPATAAIVTSFERDASLDASSGGYLALPELVGAGVAQGTEWPAYVRTADGVRFWLSPAAPDEALRDGSLRGWGWTVPRVAVVDSQQAGVWTSVTQVRRMPSGLQRNTPSVEVRP